MPTEWWLRPVRRQARVGEQRAVVWKLLNRSPPAASASRVGVLISEDARQAAQGAGLELPTLLPRGEIHLRGHEAPITVHSFDA